MDGIGEEMGGASAGTFGADSAVLGSTVPADQQHTICLSVLSAINQYMSIHKGCNGTKMTIKRLF